MFQFISMQKTTIVILLQIVHIHSNNRLNQEHHMSVKMEITPMEMERVKKFG